MFDWSDEELTNISWGEADEVGDHIVPYPDLNQEKTTGLHGIHLKKEQNREYVGLRQLELTKSAPQNISHGIKLDSGSEHDENGLNRTGYSLDTLTDLSSPCSGNIVHNSECTEASKRISDISKDKPKNEVKNSAPHTGSETFQSPLEDSEQRDFLDYGWATVGSFEDLDRIFCNEDPIFGNASTGNTDDLWTSSKGGTNSPNKLISLKVDTPSLTICPPNNKVEQFDAEAEFLSDENQSFTSGHEKVSVFTSSASQDDNSFVGNAEHADEENKLFKKERTAQEIGRSDCVGNSMLNERSVAATKENTNKKKLLKSRKKVDDNFGSRGLSNGWNGRGNQYIQLHSPYAPAVVQRSSSLGFTQQMPLEGLKDSQFKILPSPLNPLMQSNVVHPCAHFPSLSSFHPLGVGQQPITSSYDIFHGNLSPFNQPPEVPYKSLTMTPKEKIEKLRRRQQMRAMLGIQKQQQQLGSDSNSTTQDFSNRSLVGLDESSVADRILCQFQDAVAKLDIQVRLCFRDSLFRLARSATQRQYADVTANGHFGSRDEVTMIEESDLPTRFPETLDVETDTNPIDRTLAHLLFHRPVEASGIDTLESLKSAKVSPRQSKSASSMSLQDALESPLSAKGQFFEGQSTNLMSMPANPLPQESESNQILSNGESEVPCLFSEADMDYSEITKDTGELGEMET